MINHTHLNTNENDNIASSPSSQDNQCNPLKTSSHVSLEDPLALIEKNARWVLASNNKGKLSEFKRLFAEANLAISLVTQGELQIADAVEDGLSFVENAIIKARHASKASGLPAISDDSGLCVPALNNAPGIYSARYAGEHGNDAKNNAKLLADLQPWQTANPNLPVMAYFVCVLVMVRHADDPLPIIAQGLWQGEILPAPLGDKGFGYDPVFWLPNLKKSAAQLEAQTKNKLSHRGQALTLLLQQLNSLQSSSLGIV